jgi:pimeloyl-ACP methyl ester carboxylesterase
MGLHVITRPPLLEGAAHGRAPVLVAVHGTMDRATSFRRLWTCLPEWRMVAYDRRGYAGSAALPLALDFDQQISDLLEVVHGHVEQVEDQAPVVALGHSFGGDIVLAALAGHPGLVQAAVVYEPPALWHQDWPNPAAPELPDADQAEAFMRRVAGDAVWERLPDATRRKRRAEGATMANDLRMLRDGAPFDPGCVSIPVVVGYGSASNPRAATWAKQLAGLLPNAELVEVPGAEHGVHFGDPAALADLVRRAAAPMA